MRKVTEQEKIEISRRLRAFQTPNELKSYVAVMANILGLALCIFANSYLFQIAPLYTAFLWIPTAAFFGRLFVCVHDCGHQNLFASRLPNLIFGRISAMSIGLPFKFWKHYHSIHHSNANNLDKRHLDIESTIMTHDEYKAGSFWKRLQYDFTRNPVARVVVFPILLYILNKIPFWFYPKKIIIDTAISTTIYVSLLCLLGYAVSFKGLLLIYGVPMLITQVLATAIFALQHKFDSVYWAEDHEWDHFEASLFGSSHLKFGRIMNWYSGNVGFHHIHHLNPKIPFYNLVKSEKAIREVVAVNPVYLKNYFKHLKKRVWDYGERKMVDPGEKSEA